MVALLVLSIFLAVGLSLLVAIPLLLLKVVVGLVLLPLLPILFVGALLYGITRLASRPARLRTVA